VRERAAFFSEPQQVRFRYLIRTRDYTVADRHDATHWVGVRVCHRSTGDHLPIPTHQRPAVRSPTPFGR